MTEIERIFLWQGNVRILITMIKYIEDKRNASHDTEVMGVPVMLVVEDNIRYYSSFLPRDLYGADYAVAAPVERRTQRGARLVRMRARPKILLRRRMRMRWTKVTALSRLPAGRGVGR